MLKTASPTSAKHFLETFPEYLESNVTQARAREDSPPTVDEYFLIRRKNIGVLPSFVPGELHLELPDEAFYHTTITEMQQCVTDLVFIDNVSLTLQLLLGSHPEAFSLKDMTSYNKEQAAGDDRFNIVTIAMRQFNLDVAGAMQWACKYHHEIEAKFLRLVDSIPSFGPEVDRDLHEYVLHLANWPQGNYCWHFESKRYFGEKGLDVKQSRQVAMLSSANPGQGGLVGFCLFVYISIVNGLASVYVTLV